MSLPRRACGQLPRGDFVVLGLGANALIVQRTEQTSNLAECLFVLMMLGDNRSLFGKRNCSIPDTGVERVFTFESAE